MKKVMVGVEDPETEEWVTVGKPNVKHKPIAVKREECLSKALLYENLEAFRRQITQTECSCGFNGLDKLPIEYYPHDGGWDIGYKRRQWLYVTCPNCEYQWALWKLGLPR